jgi:hypothetical protein
MDSTLIKPNYANSQHVTNTSQLAKLIDVEVKRENPVGKFILLSVTPTLKDEDDYNRNIPYNAIKTVSNNKSLGLTQITKSNYIELTIPLYMFTINDIKIINKTTRSDGYLTSIESKTEIIYDTFKYGQLFIVSNIGGNLDKPQIIGVYNNDNK